MEIAVSVSEMETINRGRASGFVLDLISFVSEINSTVIWECPL